MPLRSVSNSPTRDWLRPEEEAYAKHFFLIFDQAAIHPILELCSLISSGHSHRVVGKVGMSEAKCSTSYAISTL